MYPFDTFPADEGSLTNMKVVKLITLAILQLLVLPPTNNWFKEKAGHEPITIKLKSY